MTTVAHGAARLFQPGGPPPAAAIDLGLGYPDPSTLPIDAFDPSRFTPGRRLAAVGYGPRQGNAALIDALRRTVLRDLAVPTPVLLTSGALEAVQAALRVLGRYGGRLLVEETTFPGLITVARELGLDLVPVRTGAHGIDLLDLEEQIVRTTATGRVAGLYVMPTASNPTGSCLSEQRRRDLAALVAAHGVTVIEDDAYRDVRYDGPAPTALADLAPDQVLHVRSLSKVVCPGIRLAAVSGPEWLTTAMADLRLVGGTSPYASELLADFLERVDYDAYLGALQATYRRRRDLAVARLRAHGVELDVPRGGFFLWVPVAVSGLRVYADALRAGVRVLPGAAFSVHEEDEPAVRLAFSCAAPHDLTAGIDLLAAVIDDHTN